MTTTGRWTRVCRWDDLTAERGTAALVDGRQIAVFRLLGGDLYAVQHRDPYCGANVIARGIVGTRQGQPTVASPMYKQVFCLRTGICLDRVGREPLDGETGNLVVYAALIHDGMVHLGPAALAQEPVAGLSVTIP